MTAITVYKTKEDCYRGFLCNGHAGHGTAGNDIVCASISVLVINTVNSIEKLTDQKFTVKEDEENGIIDFRFDENPTKDAVLLLDAMVLGLKEIQKSYSKYCKVNFKEV